MLESNVINLICLQSSNLYIVGLRLDLTSRENFVCAYEYKKFAEKLYSCAFVLLLLYLRILYFEEIFNPKKNYLKA